ncbi:fer-1-like protein 5 isoform X3 [Cygnus olor]|uniref:fer-1-like protein 5 isoform X3 n=1 Tax=Cygnus olor TaxID=8869 RepID=UPI001ADE0EA2|nr:fer-1-like protein 5 isoform X3 [Cygnus olor]
MDMAQGDMSARRQRYLVTRGHPLTAAVSLPVPTAAHVVSFQNTDRWQHRGDSHSVARGHNTGTQHRDTAMLRLLMASAHIPAATGAGPGVHVSARFRGVPRSTRVVPAERNPTWNETLVWPLGTRPLRPSASLALRLRHWGQPAPQGDLGATMVPLGRLAEEPGLPLALSHLPLLDPRGRPTGATVTVRCSYVPPSQVAAGDTVPHQQGWVAPCLSPPCLSPVVGTAIGVPPGPPRHNVKPATGRKEDFQVRVRVIEGHQLQGNDIKPVVTVLIGEHRFRTRIRVGNNPYYNEVFSQHFHLTPVQLAAVPIHVQVLNSRAIRAEATIGAFKLDVSTIYNAPGRRLSWKWLSLQHPRRPEAGSCGYLRVSLAVLRAGEPVAEPEEPAGSEEVEANLLQPSPLTPCVATLQLRVYRAEDLPQEEPTRPYLPAVLPAGGKRGFVAAAVQASFAGRTLCTRVMPPDANPAWNEVLFFPLRLPPVCDAIELAIISGSRAKVLGTATLHLSQISSAGAELQGGVSGFLPCFGPSFLPFYGPRPDPAKRPSTPSDTRVAYRGRVLLELSTHTGSPDGRQQDTIAPEDIARVQRLLPRRRRFGLCGVFYSATMLAPAPELLRFELSIGNYGDTGDPTCYPAASATPHGHPLFDGNRYHYLPWYDAKPVVAVTSIWEDAGLRWDATNLLQNMAQRLEGNVAALRDAGTATCGDAGRRLLRELARDCRVALPVLEAQLPKTPLDTELRAARLHLLRLMAAAAIAGPPRGGWAALLPEAEAWLGRVAALAAEVRGRPQIRGPSPVPGPGALPSAPSRPQPQAGVPDVLLWLLSGPRRVACARIPTHCLVFSPRGRAACGRLCGRTQTLFLGASGHIHAQLRVRLWLGHVAESRDLPRCLEGTLRIYAETYENQTKLLGKWSGRGLPGRPSFSDITGKAGLPRHRIRPPKGWRWDGPWAVEPPRRLLLDTEANLGKVLEEVYENESRQPGGDWGPAAMANTDAAGAAVPPKDEVACPQGWHITDGWRVDVAGAVDEAGWEYGVSAAPGSPPLAWHSAEKTYHTHRRRRWLRTRRREPSAQGQEQDVATFLQLHSPEAPAADEAWEYATLWGCRFHLRPRAGDLCRRRCWHRRMVPSQSSSVAPLFLLEGSPGTEAAVLEGEQPAAGTRGQGRPQQPMPLILCTFQRPSYFQLRCYLFQALELVPHGTKATADPVAHVSFVHISQSTRVLTRTLDLRWDQALLFHRVLLYGDPRGVRDEPPAVVVEVFDQEGEGAGSFLGRCVCTPLVWLDLGHRQPPRLRRYPLEGPGGPAGELLAAFELLHEAEEGALAQLSTPPWRDGTFSVPLGIRPLLRLVALEVLAWGLRGLRGRSLLPVRAPHLEVQCGGQVLRTPPIADLAANPNFPINAFLLPLHLPAEEEYVPPLRLRVLDTQGFGYRPEVGQACVRGLGRFCCQPDGGGRPSGPGASPASPGPAAAWDRIAQMLPKITAEKGATDKAAEREEEDEEEGDWWSKFYAAMGDTAKSHRGTHGDSLKVYSCELEAVPEFEGLQDFCQTFPLYQPGGPLGAGEDPVPVGEFKGLFHLYPLPEDPGVPPPPRHFQELPPSQPQQCLVRIYVVRAFDLSPRDRNGLCDPYIRVSLGAKTLGQRDQYVPNTVEPVFGRMFEVTGTIPLEKDLRVSLLDYDLLPPDQEIGSTTIDLENRLLSRFRAHCGLPRLYRIAGPGRWRDQLSPSRALEHFARIQGLPAPEFSADGTAVTFGCSTFLLSHFESGPPAHRHPGAPRERLALHVLRACRLVPEHLETRTLYNSTQPGLEQGKVQMWVDVFPASLGPPGPPVDITPRKPQRYELRCVVWNTRDVDLRDTNVAGQRMSDIYVTGWLDGLEEQRQRTDVHYRSLQGDGSFNWRFVFPFEYLVAERLCVLPRKGAFWSLDETVQKLPPKLILQVWDNDMFTADDFLGVLELELSRLPQPAQRPQDCALMPRPSCWPWQGARGPPHLSLFRQKRVKGWWPCTVQEGGKRRLSGKLELSLELLKAKEAEERPAGKGREEPNMYPALQPPVRPEWSFLWLQAPLRSLRYGLWHRHRCRIVLGLALLLLLALILAFVYAAPGYLAMKLVNPLQGWHLFGSASKP